jgi:hypothetical protein
MGSSIADKDTECTRVFVTIEHEKPIPDPYPVDLGNQTCIGELMGTRDVVDWCTSIPLDTPLARLVTADPSIRVIERDHSARHERACGPIDEIEGALEIR